MASVSIMPATEAAVPNIAKESAIVFGNLVTELRTRTSRYREYGDGAVDGGDPERLSWKPVENYRNSER